MDKISSTKTNKRSWFGKDRKTCFISCVPNDRYFNGKLKEVQETFLKESKEYLEQYDQVLLSSIQNQPLPKHVKTTSKPKEEKTLKEKEFNNIKPFENNAAYQRLIANKR